VHRPPVDADRMRFAPDARGRGGQLVARATGEISWSGLSAVLGGSLVFVALPIVLFGVCAFNARRSGTLGLDYDAYLLGARRLLDGTTPYDLSLLHDAVASGQHNVVTPAYPPGTLLLFSPLLALPHALGLARSCCSGHSSCGSSCRDGCAPPSSRSPGPRRCSPRASLRPGSGVFASTEPSCAC